LKPGVKARLDNADRLSELNGNNSVSLLFCKIIHLCIRMALEARFV
jgi:hypothetical protein